MKRLEEEAVHRQVPIFRQMPGHKYYFRIEKFVSHDVGEFAAVNCSRHPNITDYDIYSDSAAQNL